MNKYYYKQPPKLSRKAIARIIGACISFIGISIMIYIFMPLIIWQLTLAPVFASQAVALPIPKTTVVSASTIKSLLASSVQSIGIDYSNASNWFPGYTVRPGDGKIPSYFLSIPSLHIANAFVSTVNTDLSTHLVHLGGTAIPPDKGTAVIFGHSTLPQLFDPNNYRTIFADAYKLQIGDDITATVNNVAYKYKIFSIIVVDPDDTSVLAQNIDDSYLTIITCTPPGTVWKRLVVQARIEKI